MPSMHQGAQNADSTYPPPPPAKQLCAGSHESGRTRNSIVFCIQSSLPGSTNTSTSADIRTSMRANHLQTQLAQRADEIVERQIFQNDARVEKPLYRSLNALRIKVYQKWMCHLLPRLLLLCFCCSGHPLS